MAHVGQEIRRVREERGLNQAQLAVSVGTGPAAISRIENGRQSPNMETIEKIARALEVEVADLFPKGQSPLQLEFATHNWDEAFANVRERHHDIQSRVEEWAQLSDPSDVDVSEVKEILDKAKDSEHALWLALPGSHSMGAHKVTFDPSQVEPHHWEAIDAARDFYQQVAESLEEIGLVRFVERGGHKADAIPIAIGA